MRPPISEMLAVFYGSNRAEGNHIQSCNSAGSTLISLINNTIQSVPRSESNAEDSRDVAEKVLKFWFFQPIRYL